jgi:hypothetical protein
VLREFEKEQALAELAQHNKLRRTQSCRRDLLSTFKRGTHNEHSFHDLIFDCQVQMLVSWYIDGDLPKAKSWAYAACVLIDRLAREFPTRFNAPYWVLVALLSDHEASIEAILKRVAIKNDSPRSPDFAMTQLVLAARGDREDLGRRAQQALAAGGLPVRRIDEAFYIALAADDASAMQVSLDRMLSARGKFGDYWPVPYAPSIVNAKCLTAAKLAYRRGHRLRCESPFIPSPWLPVQPLDKYELPFDGWMVG